ncbi:hypothetical protein [uncultured Chryseobacterium sp.]|uniref:hypothetical protein n=1 Tax=uncultured Chryseobacterium sp. TaxID=259322 RepID=UPI00258DB7DF|nr:hypothetical protein [uncultured Chryseobacterium sp.]
MIAPQDLRLGNLVQYDGKIFKVKEIRNYIIVCDRGKGNVDFTVNEISPIELTEDWLLKFGYEPTTLGYWSNGKIEIGYTTTDDNIHYEYISITHKTEMTNLKYVHQLQNLFFAFTGEELTIKEQK